MPSWLHFSTLWRDVSRVDVCFCVHIEDVYLLATVTMILEQAPDLFIQLNQALPSNCYQ